MSLNLFVFVAFFLAMALMVIRSLVIARIQERNLDVGLNKYSPFKFSDNLAWRLIRDSGKYQASERRLFMVFFMIWGMFLVSLVLSLVVLLWK